MRLSDIPNIETYLNKKVRIEINEGSTFTGVLRGYDGFVNIVLDEVESGDEVESVDSYVVIKGKDILNIKLCNE